jgi:ABC-2 type transport system permease protein
VFKRDFLIYVTYRGRLIGQLLAVVFTISFAYYISRLVSSPEFPTPDDYFVFVVAGLVTVRFLLFSFSTLSTAIRQELVAGTFERMLTSPFGATAGVTSMFFFPFALAAVVALFSVVFAAVAYQMPLDWSTLPLAVPVIALLGLSVLPLTLLIASLVIAFKQAAAGARFIALGISVVSGFYFPVELLPGAFRWLSDIQPFTSVVSLLRHVLIGAPLGEPLGLSMLKVLAFAIVMCPVSLVVLHKVIDLGRRRATIIEY